MFDQLYWESNKISEALIVSYSPLTH